MMETERRQFSVPLLVIVGDEDDLCLDGSLFIKRTAPTAALLVLPRPGHTINSEEPAAVNAALAELFCTAETARWLAHKPACAIAKGRSHEESHMDLKLDVKTAGAIRV